MNSKIVTAALIGGIAAFIIGYLIFGIGLSGFMSHNTGSATGVMRTDMTGNNLVFIFLGNLAFAYLLTHIFYSWAKINTLAGGAQAGALITLLISLDRNLIGYGATNTMNLNAAIVDIIASTVFGALVGGIIGAYLGMKKTA